MMHGIENGARDQAGFVVKKLSGALMCSPEHALGVGSERSTGVGLISTPTEGFECRFHATLQRHLQVRRRRPKWSGATRLECLLELRHIENVMIYSSWADRDFGNELRRRRVLPRAAAFLLVATTSRGRLVSLPSWRLLPNWREGI